MARQSTSALTVLTYNRIELTTDDLKCLKQREFLNDKIINFYMEYLWQTYLSDHERKLVYVCDTFFITAIETSDETRIHRWLKRINVMDRDYLLIPVMMNEHWFLIVLSHPKSIFDESRRSRYPPRIHIMDSMENYDPDKKDEIIKALYTFVQAAAVLECHVSAEDIRHLRRRLPIHHADVYQQTNTFDCGICLLQNAENFLVENLHIPLSERPFQLSTKRYPRKRLNDLIEQLAAEKALFASNK